MNHCSCSIGLEARSACQLCQLGVSDVITARIVCKEVDSKCSCFRGRCIEWAAFGELLPEYRNNLMELGL